MKKVLILGANGFVGIHLAKRLSGNYQILRMARSVGIGGNDSSFFRLDPTLKLSSQIQKIFDEHPFNTLIYTWNAINAPETVMREIYVERLKEVLSFLSGKNISLIFFSAGSALRDKSRYAYYNLLAEEIIEGSDIKKWIILRPTLIFGPKDTKNLTSIFKMAKKFPIMVLPKHKQVLIRPLYIHDLSRIVLDLMNADIFPNGSFLISGKDIVDLREYVEKFLGEVKKKPLIISVDLFLVKRILRKIHQWFRWLPLEQFANSSSTFEWPHTSGIKELPLSFTSASDALKEWAAEEFTCLKN